MSASLRTEDIYDCLEDDEAFAQLPGRVAQWIGARSATFHWRTTDQAALVLADSGYWSDEQMASYIQRYAPFDLWAQSTLSGTTRNRLWALDELVPERTYRNSVFYNEWIRPMGDDTYHCIGMSLSGQSGTGLIGIHRSGSQGAFEERDVAKLNQRIAPIRRLMRVRGMLANARSDAALLGGALDDLTLEIMILSRDRALVHANHMANLLLARGEVFSIRYGKVAAKHLEAARSLDAAVDLATRPCPESSLVEIGRGDADRRIVTVAPFRRDGRRCAILLLRPSRSHDLSVNLQRCFGLTEAEAAIAIALFKGSSPSDIAFERSASVQTVRTQVKSVAAKLGCHRQAEIVALVACIVPVRRFDAPTAS